MDESGKTAAELCSYIDAGMPVVFWATLDFQPVPEKHDHWLLADGTDFAWKCNEHCLLLVGYDAEHYWFNDPCTITASAASQGAGGGLPCRAGNVRCDPAQEVSCHAEG